MIEIQIIDNKTSIKTDDIQIFIEGSFELKKVGAEAPVISVINSQR